MDLNALASLAVQVSRHGEIVDAHTLDDIRRGNLDRAFELDLERRVEMSVRSLLEAYLTAEYRRIEHGKKVTRFVDWYTKIYGSGGYVLITRKQIRSIAAKYVKSNLRTQSYVTDIVHNLSATLQLDGIVELDVNDGHHGAINLVIKRSE